MLLINSLQISCWAVKARVQKRIVRQRTKAYALAHDSHNGSVKERGREKRGTQVGSELGRGLQLFEDLRVGIADAVGVYKGECYESLPRRKTGLC